jgi:N-acetylmuramoyl-L-alanine amidase
MTQPLQRELKFRTDLDFAGLRFKKRSATLGATVHCSATKPSQDFGAVDVDRMHRQRGFLCIGYHFIIDRNGVIHAGRPMDARGAHCKNGGRNDTHISVCLIGGVSERPKEHVPGSPWNGSDAESNFTPAQGESLGALLAFLKETYGFTDEAIEGHRDVPGVRKACPSFNIETFLNGGGFELD